MDNGEVREAIGELRGALKALTDQFTLHVADDSARHGATLTALTDIKDTLSQAVGAKRIVVWLIALIFAAVALAKGWIGPK